MAWRPSYQSVVTYICVEKWWNDNLHTDTCTGVSWLITLGGGGAKSTMCIKYFNIQRNVVRKTWNILSTGPLYTMIFGKVNRNLQCLSSLANGCIRWLYPASRKTQVLNFLCCYTTQIIVWKIVLFFYSPLFNS